MKKNLSLVILSGALLLTPFQAPAELLIYKGTQKLNYNGQERTLAVNTKVFFVFDHETSQGVEISYATVNRIKSYHNNPITNLHVITVAGLNGKNSTALAYLRSQCDLDAGVSGEGILGRGPNSILTVNSNATVVFAKTLAGGGSGVSLSDGLDQAILVQGSTFLSFDRTQTIRSNAAGETLDNAAARLIAYVESLGYIGGFSRSASGMIATKTSFLPALPLIE